MKQGLAIVVTPGAYWALTQIGWLKHISGDEWELVGARVLRTIGTYVPLAELAEEGSEAHKKNVALRKAAKIPEPIHRLTMRRVVPANVELWSKEVPRPKDWADEV